MTTKRQAEICVERNLSDQEIVDMTGCHPECVEYVRAWGRGEQLEKSQTYGCWHKVYSTMDILLLDPSLVRIAPRRIHVKATLPDGTEREASFPEPVRNMKDGDEIYVAWSDLGPDKIQARAGTNHYDWLLEGRVFRTREEAKERDKAMIWISGGEVG